MILPNLNPNDTQEHKRFVLECERSFHRRLDEVSAELIAERDLRFLALSGPSCSGKTTTANKLLCDLEKSGARVRTISIDDFFRPRRELEKDARRSGKNIDMDSVNAINLAQLEECVADITAGGTVHCPVFDFTISECVGFYTFPASDYDIFLFEGIQAIYPEVTALLSVLPTKSIFISVCDDITVGEHLFCGRDVRFMRRLVRDYRFRGASPEYTFEHWDGVVSNEISSIIPPSKGADIQLNSCMGYDLCVLKEPVLELLSMIEPESRHYDKACALKEKLRCVTEISAELIPDDSIYKEFLG